MPKITFGDAQITVEKHANLRSVLLKAKLSPHNSGARFVNCKGMGTCGTCAVQIIGEISQKTAVEKWRLSFPPHKLKSGLRLACQVRVLDDLRIIKHEGFWGQHVDHHNATKDDQR